MNISKGLLAGRSIDVLQARMTREPYQTYWTQMVNRWREIDQWQTETGEIRYIGACGGGRFAWMVREAALIHRLTGDPDALAYVNQHIDRLAGFYIHNPASRVEQFGRHRPYWSHADICLAADLCRDSLDEKRRGELLRMVREEFVEAPLCGWNTSRRFLAGHNIPFTEQACAGICALLWGEEAGRTDWEQIITRVRDACVLYCRWGLDRQGNPYEGSMYGPIPLALIYFFAELLDQNKRENLFESIPELKVFPQAMQQMLFPDRTAFVPLSDGGIGSPKPFAWLLLTARHFNRPEDLGLWYEYRGPGRPAGSGPTTNNNPPPFWPQGSERGPVRRDGWGHDLLPFLWWEAEAPLTPVEKSSLPTANYSPGCEVANFRTSWSREAVYLNIAGQGRSHCGLDHGHSDCGHFTIHAHGDYLAIDTGYWNLREDQHSVVLVEGKPTPIPPGREHCQKHRAGALRGFQRHALVDYVRADAANVNGCIWADRHVLFVRLGGDEAYIVTLDNLTPDHQRHTFWWQLQAHPESEVRLTGPTTAQVIRTHARLDVTFISPPASDFPTSPPELKLRTDSVYGAYVEGHADALSGAAGLSRPFVYTEAEARREKADLTYSSFYRPRLIAEQTAPSCLLMAVIAPRKVEAAPWAVRVLPAERIFRVEVESEQYVDTIIAALDHAYLTLPDLHGFTELALIRRDKAGRVIDTWTVDGTALSAT